MRILKTLAIIVTVIIALSAFEFPGNASKAATITCSIYRGDALIKTYDVEVVDTEASFRKGLMYRKKLPEDKGMIFDFAIPRITSFWMKNTYIPLDIIFIGIDGRIVNIAENTTPLSEELISSNAVVSAVLEINALQVKKYGIKIGDEVVYNKHEKNNVQQTKTN